MSYYPNLEKINLDDLKEILRKRDLVPSRISLLGNLDHHFEIFKKHGIQNTRDLLDRLKTKNRLEKLHRETKISLDYLILLNRELKNFTPAPNKINAFDIISEDVKRFLQEEKLQNTLKLYPYLITKLSRRECSAKWNIDKETLSILARLCDVSRVKWVSPNFAIILLKSGFDQVDKIKNANPELLHLAIEKTNNELDYYKGKIGLRDIKRLIEAAQYLNIELEI